MPAATAGNASTTSLEIFHVSHGKYETASPIRTFVPYGDGRAILAAAFGAESADRFLAQDENAPALPSVLATLLRHPTLAGPFLAYNSTLLQRPTLDPRHREGQGQRQVRHFHSPNDRHSV